MTQLPWCNIPHGSSKKTVLEKSMDYLNGQNLVRYRN